MPGYGQQQLAYQARNGNTVAVLIGDDVVAFAQTADDSPGFSTEGLYGIGSALPQEIQQMRLSPSISITALALTATGIALLAGGTDITTLLANNSFDLHIVDGSVTPAVTLRTYVGCVCSNFSESIPANRPVTQSFAFLAMDVLDANGDSLLNGPQAFSVTNALAAGGAVAGGLGLNAIT